MFKLCYLRTDKRRKSEEPEDNYFYQDFTENCTFVQSQKLIQVSRQVGQVCEDKNNICNFPGCVVCAVCGPTRHTHTRMFVCLCEISVKWGPADGGDISSLKRRLNECSRRFQNHGE